MQVEDDLSHRMNYAAAAPGLEAEEPGCPSTLHPSSAVHYNPTPVNQTFSLDFDHFCPSEVEKVPGYPK